MSAWDQPPPGSPQEPIGPFAEVTLEALTYIANRLRKESRDEIFSLLTHDDPDRLARELYDDIVQHGRGRIVLYGNTPTAWVAYIQDSPGMWRTTMGGTDDLPKVAVQCVRWARWSAVLTKHDGAVLYCWSRITPDGRPQAFIKACGAVEDGEPLAIGKDGGLYQRLVWRYGDNDWKISERAARR